MTTKELTEEIKILKEKIEKLEVLYSYYKNKNLFNENYIQKMILEVDKLKQEIEMLKRWRG